MYTDTTNSYPKKKQASMNLSDSLTLSSLQRDLPNSALPYIRHDFDPN